MHRYRDTLTHIRFGCCANERQLQNLSKGDNTILPNETHVASHLQIYCLQSCLGQQTALVTQALLLRVLLASVHMTGHTEQKMVQ